MSNFVEKVFIVGYRKKKKTETKKITMSFLNIYLSKLKRKLKLF